MSPTVTSLYGKAPRKTWRRNGQIPPHHPMAKSLKMTSGLRHFLMWHHHYGRILREKWRQNGLLGKSLKGWRRQSPRHIHSHHITAWENPESTTGLSSFRGKTHRNDDVLMPLFMWAHPVGKPSENDRTQGGDVAKATTPLNEKW